jgi:hypothetical protein
MEVGMGIGLAMDNVTIFWMQIPELLTYPQEIEC